MSVRTRLSVVYGTLFLISAGLLVGVTYLLTVRAIDSSLGKPLVQVTYRGDGSTVADPLNGVNMMATAQREVDSELAARKQAVLDNLLRSSVLLLIALGLLAVLIGYVMAGRMLRPLHTVTETARRLSESTLHERIALKGPQDEIKDLADTFDRMLDRLHRAFDAQRRFVANASHELRTPLTINRTVLEVALAGRRNPPETKALAEVLLGNTARHERLIEGLLLLAKSERELATAAPVSLPDVARTAVDQVEVPPGLKITTDLDDAATFGDPVLLERCAVNLLENAVKYNIADGRVEIVTGRADGDAFLRVSNTGRPVPPYEIGRIFEPFRRLRNDRTGSAEGAGLGLSIVAAVVRVHGGTVEAVPRDGGGLIVTLRLHAPPSSA
ncbi:sensor histidine kinase [Actinomadura rayongensis]|uniref:histidine kinase n=1 Tax=Actinomadura rayongensis TaxID=1429076 RepID=A0A6I4WH93_9ACTN|nr:HAMP domain-containing sensor histidine kinase [Actinomadura rayongensis]MXQ66364.1 HAMP domain-containing protein [Actinomadura rayongensis]